MEFSDKVVLITGAGSGMGKAVAINFAKLSAKLCLIDINADTLKETVTECKNAKDILMVNINVTNDEDVKMAINKAVEKFKRIDVVVNCAGIVKAENITNGMELRWDDVMDTYDKVIAVNLRATIAVTTFATPALIESKGIVINISSISAVAAMYKGFSYCVSKACVSHFTKCAASELAQKGIRVNCILPGPVKTNIFTNMGVNKHDNDVFFEIAKNVVPLKRLVDVSDIAELVAYLASDKSKSMTGGCYVMDSGNLLVGLDYSRDIKSVDH